MSAFRIASVAHTLAQRAVGSAAAARDTELHGCLTDLLVHLGYLKVQCAVIADQVRASAGDDDVEPTAIIG
ncbi:hypothetical protein [Urbifossiella limnaea]|uniref:Uncharacterized protein n=1 Tax=Urbifossiella limnaea TaxID=2528023 RepID=A0A517XLD6_9BACT|nr:hypothetical protein [Urbifossiella limnaea]QDU18318.1 hypothetical protein ETAA1_02030 [Urbifossiella limnaea]